MHSAPLRILVKKQLAKIRNCFLYNKIAVSLLLYIHFIYLGIKSYKIHLFFNTEMYYLIVTIALTISILS